MNRRDFCSFIPLLLAGCGAPTEEEMALEYTLHPSPKRTAETSGYSNVVFPPTQIPSTNPNALDDYAEGSWTPALAFTGGTTGITYSIQSGVYTKIGRLLIMSYSIVLTSKGSSTGSARIQGFPYSLVTSGGASASHGVPRYSGLLTNWYGITLQARDDTSAYITGVSAAGTTNATELQHTDIGNSLQISGNIFGITAT